MSGDYSRHTFDPLRDVSAVLQQQGRVALDADWNELVAVIDRRLRAETVDIIGRCVVPRETPSGFAITIGVAGANKTMDIGRGRIYVHGLLAENHGTPSANFDLSTVRPSSEPEGVLAELLGDSPVSYTKQPYWPVPDPLPGGNGPHLVYLDVWQRELGYLEEPAILEDALRGVDTTTRLQTVWQVKLLPDVGAGVTCATPDAHISGWPELREPSAGRLTTQTAPVVLPADPCQVPPHSGYRGLENQLYRVEIHDPGPPGTASFKWSQDNATVATHVTQVLGNDELEVERIGRDDTLRFNAGDWIELTDDRRELANMPGEMVRIVSVTDETRRIKLHKAIPGNLIPSGAPNDTAATRHTRIQRWDQKGKILDANGNQIDDLTAANSTGVITVPAAGNVFVNLGNGIQIALDVQAAGGEFHAMDYWNFSARTSGTIEILNRAPPRGIHHHYCRLAVITFPGTVKDCRIFWPPKVTDESCACSVCVTAESHNSGVLTIQNAIDQVVTTGGTVCLAVGDYELGENPLRVADAQSVRIVGQGWKTVLAYTGDGAAIDIRASTGVTVEQFTVIVLPRTVYNFGAGNVRFGGGPGFRARDCIDLNIRRCAIVQLPGGPAAGHGIALEGYILGVNVQDNVLFAPDGIAGTQANQHAHAPYLLTANLRAHGNLIVCRNHGITFQGISLHAAGIRISGNTIVGGDNGAIAVTGAALPGCGAEITGNGIYVEGDGIIAGVSGVRISDNDVAMLDGSQGPQPVTPGGGIVLTNGLDPGGINDGQLHGNRITGVAGYGIFIKARLGTLMIKSNMIRNTVSGGIVMDADAEAMSLVVENNQLSDISAALDDKAQPLAAIRLVNATQVTATTNSVRGFAQHAVNSRACTAIEILGVRLVRVSDNDLADIGPDRTLSGLTSIGIHVGFGFEHVQLSGNRLRRAMADTAPQVEMRLRMAGAMTNWRAILIEDSPDLKDVAADNFALPFYILDENHLAVVGRARVVIAPLSRRPSVTLEGNHAASWGGGVPVVSATVPEGSCVFSHNQCFLLDSRGPPAVVTIEAESLVFANNVVRRAGDEDAVRLFGKNFTVLGNITMGDISVNGGGLTPPWDALNVRAS